MNGPGADPIFKFLKAARLEAAGEGRADAFCHAVAQTFRAVVMVIVASGLGMLPIALSTGIGAVNRVGIGAASVGGILVAGSLTLLLLPFLGMRGTGPDSVGTEVRPPSRKNFRP